MRNRRGGQAVGKLDHHIAAQRFERITGVFERRGDARFGRRERKALRFARDPADERTKM